MIRFPEKIISNRLTFKPITIEDINKSYEAFEESFQSLNQFYSPAWAKYETIPSKEDMFKFWKTEIKYFNNEESFLFVAYNKENNKLIGHATIHHFDSSVPKARLGYWVRDSKNGKGYATEFAEVLTDMAFKILKCERLEIRNDVRNKASGKIAKNLNYRFLNIFEKNKQGKKGDFWNLEIYALLKEQYKSNNKIEYIYD